MRLLPILAVLALAACSSKEEDNDPDDMDFAATDWSAQVAARPGSAVQGSATMSSVGLEGGTGTSTASVSIGGAAPGSRHPWHVHTGSCANTGGIVGDPGAYPLLEVGADGRASATASIAVGLDDEGAYNVNVHRSTAEMSTVIACGDLRD